MITPENSYWLLVISVVGTIIMLCILIWGFWSKIKQVWGVIMSIRFRSPIFRRERLFQNGVPEDKGVHRERDSEWLEHFDSLFQSHIESVIFVHLWSPAGQPLFPSTEPYLIFICNIVNNTPFSILITGVEGRTQINGVSCQLNARWSGGESRVLPHRGGGGNVRIEQPLFPESGEALIERIGTKQMIRFSLDDVYFTGIIEDTQNNLPKIRAGKIFDVDGAGITREHSQANLQISVFRK